MDRWQNIPAELRNLGQWVMWRYEQRGDRVTKVPCTPTGASAKSTDPATWATFDQVMAAAAHFDGIGFVFSEHDPFCGCDFDAPLDAGKLATVQTLASYTERSPSGAGLHVIVRAALPGPGRNDRKAGREIYDRGRYFTMTGDIADGAPASIEARQAEIDAYYATFKQPDTVNSVDRAAAPVDLDDQTLLQRMFASRSGAAILQLWNGVHGDDESAADLALCNYLAFWTGADAARMDRLFRQSGLMREKWDKRARTGETYGAGTIRVAIEGTANAYRAPAELPELTYPAAQAGAVAPPLHEFQTDLGNGQRFARLHGDDLRFVQAWGWLFWDGARWKTDDTGHVMRLSKSTALGLYDAARAQYATVDRLVAAMQAAADDQAAQMKSTVEERTKEAKRALEWALKSQTRARLEAIVSLAESELPIPARADAFDTDPWLLNVANGTIDLKTGALLPHDRTRMLTKVSPVQYDPDAPCPLWLSFLDKIFAGNAQLIDYLQRVFGYCLTGLAVEQYLFMLWGSGANGKTTLVKTLLTMLGGEYSAQSAPELLMASTSRHPTELADLRGKRFVASIEVDDGKKLAVSLTKLLTGGDNVKARFMHQDFFEFIPTHKLFLVANHKPTVTGTDPAIWRRIRLIPFEVTIPEAERDKDLVTKLEAELPGILAWCVRGLLAWRKVGLMAPDAVRKATEAYQTESDALANFIAECLVTVDGAEVQAKDLYNAYKIWCDDNGEAPANSTKFGRDLVDRGFDKYRHPSTGKTYYMGIGMGQ